MLLGARIFLLEEGTYKYDRGKARKNCVQMDWNRCKFIYMDMCIHMHIFLSSIYLKSLQAKTSQ